MKLDIIVPHYDEPWKTGKKLFDMLALQRDVDFREFRVLLINDGEENDVSEQVFRQKYPFEVVTIVIPHAGVSAARNRGIRYSNAQWVMFCDFDDTFTSIYSLRSIFDALDTEKHDLLWCPFYVELCEQQKRQIKKDFNWIFIHGKVYRRSFLIQHGIFFEESLDFSEDAAFNQLIGMEIDQDRIGEMQSEIVPYVWTYRPGSATTNPEKTYSNAVGLFRRQKYVAQQHLLHGEEELHDWVCTRAMCDAYVTMHRADLADRDMSEFDREVWEFWREQKDRIKINLKVANMALKGSLKEFGLNEDCLTLVRPPFLLWIDEFSRQHEKESDAQ